MKKRNFSKLLLVAGLYLGTASIGYSSQGYVGYHQDYRKAPKLVLEIDQGVDTEDPAVAARKFLIQAGERFQWQESQLELDKVKESLAGTHVHFRQVLNGVAVRKGEVVVSVRDGKIFQVFNNFYPGGKIRKSKSRAVVSKDQAFEFAWQDLKVHGKLQSAPQAELAYVVDAKGRFRLAYITFLHVDAPFGAWEHTIDAETGEIIAVKDSRLERKKSGMAAMRGMHEGPVADRRTAFAAYSQKSLKKSNVRSLKARADATGLVFDPDPRTTLKDESLMDNSDEELFDDAYLTGTLRDVSYDGTNYSLEGPWVTIKDFESPDEAPSTTTDGNWTAKRGDNAFNDAMTYYHIDKNQRYIQSLGFVDERAVQGVSIEADTNGVGGDDNSHYIPGRNRMAFGHGCVDDNEDADVVLHEYGHAINYSINSSWGGGDAGAMGEGFGDYWAGSYSISTTNGLEFMPNLVFTWDGEPCWSGRIMNAMDLMYDHDRTYGAHGNMGGGRQTDELWSTPLFQALLAILEAGGTREEADTIVLESQFGLGSGLKMRDLASAVVATAGRLYPDGPHADIYFEKFAHHDIVEVPHAVLSFESLEIEGMGDNGAIDPGESITLVARVANSGTANAESIEGVLSTSSSAVEITGAESSFSDIAIGASAMNETPFALTVGDDFACGDKIELDLALEFVGGASRSASLPMTLATGVAEGVEVSDAPDLAIPDNDDGGVMAYLDIETDATVVVENFKVAVDIVHTYIGDLKVTLVSPAGTSVVLHDNTGRGSDNISGTYPTTLTPAGDLADLGGEELAGTWTLKIVDSAGRDVGELKSWGIEDITGYDCE